MEEGSSDRWPSHQRRRRRGLADLNADEPDDDTEEYYNNSNHDCSSDSEETISDTAIPASTNNDHGGGGGGGEASSSSPATAIPAATAGAAATAMHACPFCWKEFRSHKAVCGHMKVHREQQHGIKIKKPKRSVAAAAPVRTASNRGWLSDSRGRRAAASTNAAESDRSLTPVVVVAAKTESKIVLQPIPLAFAAPTNPSSPVQPIAASNDSSESSSSSSSSSKKPMHKEDAMDTVVVARTANPNPPTEAILVHPHTAPPPPAAGDRQSPEGYTCKKCGMWFRTHQGLGGHMVGHKNRERAAPAAAAVQNQNGGGGGGDGKPAKMHVCRFCGAEFTAGVQLGGHMRKHWPGPPIHKKPRLVVQVQPLPLFPPPPAPSPPPRTTTVGMADADLTLALPVKAEEAPAPAPMPGRVLLFGIDIGPGVQTPAAGVEQGSPSATVIGAHQ